MTQPTFHSLAQAVEVYYEELRRFILSRTGSAALAEDIVQETWIRAARTALPENPRAYLYRMASNLAVDHLRKTSARQKIETADVFDDPANREVLLHTVSSSTPAPEEQAAAREEFAILCNAIDELPDKCRTVFLLYRARGLSMKEIAEKLGLSPKTVENHIARALLHCRKRMREIGRNV